MSGRKPLLQGARGIRHDRCGRALVVHVPLQHLDDLLVGATSLATGSTLAHSFSLAAKDETDVL
jgi:hypothetical protein